MESKRKSPSRTKALRNSDRGRWATIRWIGTKEQRRGIITDVQISGGTFLALDQGLVEDFRFDSRWQIVKLGGYAKE